MESQQQCSLSRKANPERYVQKMEKENKVQQWNKLRL